MSAADDPQVSAGSGRALPSRPGRGAPGGSARYRGRDDGLRDTGRRPRQCVAATGVAVAVMLCMCWMHASRGLPGFAMRSGDAVQATVWIRPAGAGHGAAGCAGGPGRDRSHLQGRDWFRRGPGGRRQPVRVFLAAYVRSQPPASGSPGPGQFAEGVRVPGWRGIILAPGTGCRPAGRWLGGGYQAVSYRLPSGAARHGIGVLAFNGQGAWGPGRSRRGGCAAGGAADRVLRLDAAFPDPGASGIAHIARADLGSRAVVAGAQLQQAPGRDPALICVMIRPDRRGPGVSAPERWCGAYGGSGGQVGSGDRASLPGRSSRYRVIVLVCPRCGTTMECLFCDEGDPPLCAHSAHGQMEVQR